jgi:hypothetical protein
VTGVGCHDGDATWAPPYCQSERWDDECHKEIEIPVMTQRQVDGLHGFVLHDACWCLLQKAFEPKTIPIQRLLEACESLPFPLRTSTVSWGHDFGGLWALESQTYFPWQEEFCQPCEIPTVFWDGLENPFSIPEIPEMLSARIELPFAKTLIKLAEDCFGLFPWEIREKIGILLSTTDALSLRCASASFLPLYVSGSFWASRFSTDGERGFLFEVWGSRKSVDLLQLYRLSRSSCYSPGLRNRQRIWGLIKSIMEIIQQRRANIPLFTTNQIWAQCTWVRATCDIKFEAGDRYWSPFYQGCRSLGTCIVNTPEDLVKIGITTIKIGVRTYVTGIRFMSRNESSVRVGYYTKREELLFTTNNLSGFRVAISQSGIRALQVVSENGYCSRWAGDPAAMPVSDHLVGSKPLTRIAVSFDVSMTLVLSTLRPLIRPI